MTPYKEGQNVIIDPTIANKNLAFGEVKPALYKKIGKIVECQYMRIWRTMTYKVLFEGEKEAIWFLEKEIG